MKRTPLPHRPLTPAEVEASAGGINREGSHHPLRIDLDVASPIRPEPKTTVHRDGDLWRVSVEIQNGTATRREGLDERTIPRRGGAIPNERQLLGLLPEGAPVRVKPSTEDVVRQRIDLRGPKGRRDYTPLVVFPGDARTLLTDSSWPWRLTGRVTTSDGGVGAGVLVGDRLMLTAHHMRPARTIAQGSWWMNFTPNFDSGRAQNAPFGTSNVSSLQHYDVDSDNTYIVGHDYMLCRLYEPLGQRLGYLGATTFDDSWRGWQVWHNIGYPNDVGNGTRPAVQFNQSMEDDYEDDDGQIIETEASLNHGNSGGPFFSWFTDGHVRLCSVVAAGAPFGDDLDNALAGGDDMINLISWGRGAWPA